MPTQTLLVAHPTTVQRTQHPNEDVLELFILKRLPKTPTAVTAGPYMSEVRIHVQQCGYCQQRVDNQTRLLTMILRALAVERASTESVEKQPVRTIESYN